MEKIKKIEVSLLILAIIAISLAFVFFYAELKGYSKMLVMTYGFLGLFLLAVGMDTIIQPISPDILVFSATFGGADLLTAALVGGLGSCLAGVFGYLIGNKLGARGFQRWFGEKHLLKGKNLFKKYGVWAVIVGAFSPLPYSSVCWTAGIYHMKFSTFLITSLLTRIPRFFLVGLIGFLI